MSINILDCILDEEFRTLVPPEASPDEHDVPAATFATSDMKAAIDLLSLTTASGFGGFPQHAQKTNFVSSSNPVTDYFLVSNADGDPFPAGGVATGLYVGDDQVFLFATADPNVVVGRIGTLDTADAGGDVAMIIGLEETKDTDGFVTNADLWLCLFAPLSHDRENLFDSADELDLSGLIYLGSDFDTTTTVPFNDFTGVPSGNNLFNVIFSSDPTKDVQLLLTGSEDEELGTVNVSTQGIGANSQHVDTDATLRIDTVRGMTRTNVDAPPEVNMAGNVDYAARINLVSADFEITQTNANGKPADLLLTCFLVGNTDQEQAYLDDVIDSDGTAVFIDKDDVIIIDADGNDITAAWDARAGTSIVQEGNGVRITGLLEDDRVAFNTGGESFNRILITNVDSKETFDVGNINVRAIQGGTDTEFEELGSHLVVQDDSPLIALSGDPAPALEVDETDLATDDSDDFSGLFDPADFGADGEGSLTYELGVTLDGTDAPDSGLTDTATGNAVFLFVEGGKVVGREGDDATDAETGAIVFEISVDADGNVELDQRRAVVHVDANNHNSSTGMSAASLVTLTARAFDAEATDENDSASVTANIGDSFAFVDDGPVITPQTPATLNDLVVGNSIGATDSSSYGIDPGEDGLGALGFLNPDTAGDFRWAYHDWDGDGTAESHEIKGTYKGADLYKMILEPDGDYTLEMLGTLPSTPLPLSSEEIKAGGPNSPSIEVGILGVDPRFVKITATGGPINESNDNVGVTNGNFDTGEALTFELFSGTTVMPIQGISIGTKSASGGTYGWTAVTVGGQTITGDDESVLKNGTILIDPEDLGFQSIVSITITKEGGSTTKIGIDDIDILVPPADFVLDFDVRLTDDDDDYADAGFTVSIDGNNDGSITSPITANLSPAMLDASAMRQLVDFSSLGIDQQQNEFLLL